MPVFEYKAFDKKGKKVGGIVTAEGPAAARLKLSREGVYPVRMREVRAAAGKAFSKPVLERLAVFQRIHPAEVTAALRQLATLVSSGLPLLECLGGLIEQTEQRRLHRIFTQIRETVLEGGALHRAMADHPAVFNAIDVNMVKAGEEGGALDVILRRLADFSERRVKLRRRVESAMAYPLFLFLISSVILVFLMAFVMPKVVGIFEGMELSLPLATRVLIATTAFLRSYWWLLAVAAVGLSVAAAVWVRTERGGRVWDLLRLRAPLVGRLHAKAVIARFTRTLSILLRSGIPLVGALNIARLSTGNRLMEESIADTARQVGEGADFGGQLRSTGRFPPLVVQLVRAGEQSGELEDMLEKAAEVYEEEVETAIAALTSILEPAIILLMGVAVLFMVLAILLPIFDMTGAIR